MNVKHTDVVCFLIDFCLAMFYFLLFCIFFISFSAFLHVYVLIALTDLQECRQVYVSIIHVVRIVQHNVLNSPKCEAIPQLYAQALNAPIIRNPFF